MEGKWIKKRSLKRRKERKKVKKKSDLKNEKLRKTESK